MVDGEDVTQMEKKSHESTELMVFDPASTHKISDSPLADVLPRALSYTGTKRLLAAFSDPLRRRPIKFAP
jgi:hypothetical protein